MSATRARRRDLRLVPVAFSAWLAALAGIHLPQVAAGSALVGIVVGLAALALAGVRRGALGRMPERARTALVITAVCLAVCGATLGQIAFAQPARATAQSTAALGGRALEVTATVVGKVERGGVSGLRFDALAHRVDAGPTSYPADVPVEIHVSPDDVGGTLPLDVGAIVIAHGTAFPADLGDRAVFVVVAGRGVDVIRSADGLLAATAALRHGLVDAIAGLPPPGAGLIPGLAVGDTSAVDSELDAVMKSSSLSHLTAVSGANCALVVGLAFAGAALLGTSRAVRVAAGAVALVGFVCLVTPEPSVVRAGAMAGIAMMAVLLGRIGAGLSVLSLAVAVVLIADPWLAASFGFVLSAAATAALLLLAGPLAGGLGRWMPQPVALALSVPLAAQVVTAPILVLIAPQVSPYGVVANLLAAPAAPVATVLGLAACLAAPLPPLQSGLAVLAWLPAAWIAATAHTIAQLPGAVVPWEGGAGGAVLLTALGVAGATLLVSHGTGRGARRGRLVSAVLLCGALGCGAGTWALAALLGPLTVPPSWAIAACDVGQGDAVLLRSEGRVALVDTGPDADAAAACLQRFGIAELDLLVLTHFDLDHVGGVEAVVGRVGTVLHGPSTTAESAAVLDRLADAGAVLRQASAGLRGSLGGASWRVLWPPPRSHAFPEGNDASIVVDIVGGGIPRSIFLGDLAAAPQRALAATGSLWSRYDVVKVAHHGSADQDADLYAMLRPAIALVTVGVDNDYDHPRSETLDLLRDAGSVIARTDLEGAVVVSVTDRGLSLWRERAPPAVGGPR